MHSIIPLNIGGFQNKNLMNFLTNDFCELKLRWVLSSQDIIRAAFSCVEPNVRFSVYSLLYIFVKPSSNYCLSGKTDYLLHLLYICMFCWRRCQSKNEQTDNNSPRLFSSHWLFKVRGSVSLHFDFPLMYLVSLRWAASPFAESACKWSLLWWRQWVHLHGTYKGNK